MERKPKIDDDSYMLLDDLVSKGIKGTPSPPYVNISLSYLREGIKLLNLGLQIQDQKSRRRFNRLRDAQVCFKKCRDVIISALNNKSVSTKDRFMVWKLHVAATNLMSRSVKDPEAAVTDCLSELHNLPAIQKMFSVFLKHIEITTRVLLDSYDSMINSEYTNHHTWPSIKNRPYVPSSQIFAHE